MQADYFPFALGVRRHSDYGCHADDAPALALLEIGGIPPPRRPVRDAAATFAASPPWPAPSHPHAGWTRRPPRPPGSPPPGLSPTSCGVRGTAESSCPAAALGYGVEGCPTVCPASDRDSRSGRSADHRFARAVRHRSSPRRRSPSATATRPPPRCVENRHLRLWPSTRPTVICPRSSGPLGVRLKLATPP